MKQVFVLLSLLILLSGCVGKFGVGGDNAAQYIKEKLVLQSDNIKSIETIEEDSLMTDLGLYFRDDNKPLLKSDIIHSWIYGIVVNDSLRKLEKYDGMWRKVFTVCVTMKSGKTHRVRVLMDEDGTTPRETEDEFLNSLP